MHLKLSIGTELVPSFQRLSYSPWHAIAELIDNAVQSYLDHRTLLDDECGHHGPPLEVFITYTNELDNGVLRISDNAMGLAFDGLERALTIGSPASENVIRGSSHGIGMKAALVWLGGQVTIRSKRFGELREHVLHIDWSKTCNFQADSVRYEEGAEQPARSHYTIIEASALRRKLNSHALGKIGEYLSSMYRIPIRDGWLRLVWRREPALRWSDFELRDTCPEGKCRNEFSFEVHGKQVRGWIGILREGNHGDAGFSVFAHDRMVRGWPTGWRPTSVYGRVLGSNDLVNQRLVGEIHLNGFDLNYTKDDFAWGGDEEQQLDERLGTVCQEYRELAKSGYKKTPASESCDAKDVFSSIIAIQSKGSATPLFVIHGSGGNVPGLQALAKHLGPHQPIYGIRSQALEEGAAPLTTVEDMAKHYIQRLRVVQPQGPYCLLGFSFGGLIAFEMAQQLAAVGQEVGFLGMLDTHNLSYAQRVHTKESTSAKGSRLLQRIRSHWRESQKTGGLWPYLKGRLKSRVLRIYYQLAAANGKPVLASLKDTQELNQFAAAAYEPSVFPGCLALFRVQERTQHDDRDSDLGWSQLARDGVQVVQLPGKHVHLLKEPAVSMLAEHLRIFLSRSVRSEALLFPSLSS